MGAAVRSVQSQWRTRADNAWSWCTAPSVPHPQDGPSSATVPRCDVTPLRLDNAQLRSGVLARVLRTRGVGALCCELLSEGGAGRGRKRMRAQRAFTLQAPLARGLCLGADQHPQYVRASSVVVHVLMFLRSAHLPGDWYMATLPGSTRVCSVVLRYTSTDELE